ncbi:MAG: TonB-dependent receptor [Polyangiaceae bacterium]|nr:TonB-dependent receptor [Polyangiaceae bacterium]
MRIRRNGATCGFGSATMLAAFVLRLGDARADNVSDVERADVERASAGPDVVTVHGREAGGFVSQARIEDSPREITDAASLVEPLPGVHVRRLGADDSFSTLSIRGASSTQVAVYLAGVPLSGGADPSLDLATLPLWPGVRARVYRSFAPASLGRGSLGGTLVLDPPSVRSPARTDAWTAVGSFGELRMRVGDVRGDPDGVRIATGLSASRSDDNFSYLDADATRRAGHDVFTTRTNAGHAAASGLVSVGLPVRIASRAGAGALTITALAQARRQELPGSASETTPSQRLDSSRLVSVIDFTVPMGGGTFGVRGWGRRETLSLRDSKEDAAVTFGPTSTDDTIVAAGTSIGYKGRPFEDVSIETRIDGSLEHYAPGTWVGATQPPSARRSSIGLAFDGSAQVSSVTVLATSARADAWFDTGGGNEIQSNVRPTGNAGFETAIGPVIVAGHGGAVARPPSFIERFGNRGMFLGNPSLRPESATTVDLGARFDHRSARARVHLEGAAFATWAHDLIVFASSGAYGLQKSTNIGSARLAGIEAEARASLFGFDARVSETALATSNESECRYVASSCERPPLPGRPKHDLVADLVYTLGPVRVRYGIDWVSGITTDTQGRIVVPNRILHSAGLRFAVPPGLTTALEVRNLLNLRAVEYPGLFGPVRAPVGDLYDFPLPGRRILFTVEWTTPGPS